MRHSAVSPGEKYVVSWNSDRDEILTVSETNGFVVYASVDISKSIRKIIARNSHYNDSNDRLEVTQISWENVGPDSNTATKVGIVVRNWSVLVVVDVKALHREPVVVPQSHVDGISHFEWIPPARLNCNASQFAVFTRNNIQMKVYSLERTRVVCTVLKPVVPRILVRPRGRRKTMHWSILATSPSGENTANKYTLYHFVNEGPISTMFYSVELDVAGWSPRFQIEWSPLGDFFACFSPSLNGYELSVYNSLGAFSTTHRETGQPILRVEHSLYNDNEKNVDVESRDSRESHAVVVAPASMLWFGDREKNEYAVVVGPSLDNHLVIQSFCVNSFRIEQTTTLPLYQTPDMYLWRKVHGSEYRKSVVSKFPTASAILVVAEIRTIKLVDQSYLVVQFESHVFVYAISVDHQRLSFDLMGLFMFTTPIKDVIDSGNGSIFVVTRDCVFEYRTKEDTLRLVYENMLLQTVHFSKGKLYFATALEWDKYPSETTSTEKPEVSASHRFNVSATEEITDTFALQRLKKRKL